MHKNDLLSAALGAVVAIAIAFVVVAVLGAGGVPVMFDPDRELYGWEGAQYGMLLLIFIGFAKVWPFPVIALGGAAMAIIVHRALYRGGNRTEA